MTTYTLHSLSGDIRVRLQIEVTHTHYHFLVCETGDYISAPLRFSFRKEDVINILGFGRNLVDNIYNNFYSIGIKKFEYD